mmetsp:Transcript_20542/g.46545  ORF Transcript_20542/g.46545 Transcript_20542/m.46545 type:complete len:250 (+) Transcript_20542:1047-1796(+)
MGHHDIQAWQLLWLPPLDPQPALWLILRLRLLDPHTVAIAEQGVVPVRRRGGGEEPCCAGRSEVVGETEGRAGEGEVLAGDDMLNQNVAVAVNLESLSTLVKSNWLQSPVCKLVDEVCLTVVVQCIRARRPGHNPSVGIRVQYRIISVPAEGDDVKSIHVLDLLVTILFLVVPFQHLLVVRAPRAEQSHLELVDVRRRVHFMIRNGRWVQPAHDGLEVLEGRHGLNLVVQVGGGSEVSYSVSCGSCRTD